MKSFEPIKDTIYPVLSNEERKRRTVRAVLLNEKDEVYLLHIKCVDAFGKRDHFETPGGGVEEGESDLEALKREIREETGYTIKDALYLGESDIEYHLLKRWDCASMFLCKTDQMLEPKMLEYEKEIFKKPLWVPIKDIVSFYEKHPAELVGGMIHKRDLSVFEYALSIILGGGY